MKSFRRISLCATLLALCCSFSNAADLRLRLNHNGSDASVELSGDAGNEYLIESARGSANAWTPVTSFVLTDPSRLWKDVVPTSGNRFFRARSKAPGEAEFASNFRLIDQNNVSRELYYYITLPTLKAIVLTFADGNYSAFAPKIAQLKSAFPNNVYFWTIETGVNTTRSNILKQATAAGINWPVYQDPMQLVTHDYGAHFNGEAVVIQRDTMTVVYRGVIDDAAGTNYVRLALDGLANAKPIITTRLEPAQGEITARARVIADYTTEIAPLLQTKCVTCHSPDNVAPFALTNYASVVEQGALMKEEILARRMPPWHADPEYGKFHNDFGLSQTQMAQLVDWIDAGMPRGNGAIDPLTNIPPAPPKWPVELGEPDQVVTIPVQTIPANGTVDYRYIYANATNTTDKWLKAAVVRPGNRRVVHHYIVWEGHSSAQQLSGIAGYAPGKNPRMFPEGTGVLLKANSPITFNLHYTASGTEETDQPELGLWYADAPPSKTLKTLGASSGFFFAGFSAIPAGNSDYQMTADAYMANNQTTLGPVILNTPIRLYSLSPHMHLRGLRMRFELTMPGSSTKQILLNVPKYDFDWQPIYIFENPIDLPAGARIDVIGGFDNSAQNIYNPDPAVNVKWGEQSWEEMFIGYMEFSDL